jgi:hypothetical protein
MKIPFPSIFLNRSLPLQKKKGNKKRKKKKSTKEPNYACLCLVCEERKKKEPIIRHAD